MPPTPPPMMPHIPQQHNPYDFIMSPGAKPKKSLLPKGNSPLQRVFIVVIILFVVLLVGGVIASLLGNRGTASVSKFVVVAAEQQEIVRLASSTLPKLKTQTAKTLAATTAASVASDQTQLLAQLQRGGTKVGTASLNAKRNTQSDTKLTQAAQTGQLDAVFTSTLEQLLSTYRNDLNAAYKISKNPTTRSILTVSYNNASLILAPPTAKKS